MRWLLSLIFMVPAIASAGAPMGTPKGAASLRLAMAEGAGGQGNAERLFSEMKYEESLEAAEGVLVSPGVGPEELVAAYRWKGLSLASLGRAQEAVTTFAELLSIDPSFILSTDDGYSPTQLLPLFRAVRYRSKMGHEPIGLEHAPPKWVGTAEVLVLEVLVEADSLGMIRGVNLRYREEEAGDERHMAVPVDGPGVVRMSLPAGRGGGELYYHFEAVNGHGGILARCGSVEDPFYLRAIAEVAAPAEDEESALSTWGWVVSGVGGALLAGGGVCGGLALSLDGELSGDCPGGGCPPGRSGDIGRMDDLAVATNILWGAGAAAVLAGVVMLLWEGGDGASMGTSKGDGSVSVLPAGGEGFSGISVFGRW